MQRTRLCLQRDDTLNNHTPKFLIVSVIITLNYVFRKHGVSQLNKKNNKELDNCDLDICPHGQIIDYLSYHCLGRTLLSKVSVYKYIVCICISNI
jgi:hypothetical protein